MHLWPQLFVGFLICTLSQDPISPFFSFYSFSLLILLFLDSLAISTPARYSYSSVVQLSFHSFTCVFLAVMNDWLIFHWDCWIFYHCDFMFFIVFLVKVSCLWLLFWDRLEVGQFLFVCLLLCFIIDLALFLLVISSNGEVHFECVLQYFGESFTPFRRSSREQLHLLNYRMLLTCFWAIRFVFIREWVLGKRVTGFTELSEDGVELNSQSSGFLLDLAYVVIEVAYCLFDSVDAFCYFTSCEVLWFSSF